MHAALLICYTHSTAVGKLLSALVAQGTAGLSVLKSLRTWACSALLYKLVYASGRGRPAFDDPTAVLLQKTHGKLSVTTSSSRDWHAVLCEVGAVVLAMASCAGTSSATVGAASSTDDSGAALLATIKRYLH
jgi:hypothetical protein